MKLAFDNRHFRPAYGADFDANNGDYTHLCRTELSASSGFKRRRKKVKLRSFKK
jgi:hypothetical protein